MWYIIIELFFNINFVMLGVMSFIFDFLVIFWFFLWIVFVGVGNGSLDCRNLIVSWFVVEFYGMFCDIIVMYFIILFINVVF